MTENARTDAKAYSAGTIKWYYPHRKKPPMGKKLNILQEGGIAIHGEWKWNAGFIAWQDLFKRDYEQEAEFKEWLATNTVS